MTLIRFHILSLRPRPDAPFPSQIAARQASRKIGAVEEEAVRCRHRIAPQR